MFTKDVEASFSFLGYARLVERANVGSQLKIELTNQLRRLEFGYAGEKNVRYYLEFNGKDNFCYLHNVELSIKHHIFQLDWVVLTPSCIIIFEVKNFKGKVFFDSNQGQFIRTYNNETTAYENPFTQISRHENLLSNWFLENKFKLPPIIAVVVMGSSSTLIEIPHNHPEQHRVIKVDFIPEKIKQIIKTNHKIIYSKKEQQQLSEKLVQSHLHRRYAILERHKLSTDQLIRGVKCTSCRKIAMQRVGATWICAECKHIDKDAHVETLLDYYYLISDEISAREFKWWTNTTDARLLANLNRRMGMRVTPRVKNAKYRLIDLLKKK